MRRIVIALLVLPAICAPARAQDGASPSVIACESLVGLRLLMAEGGRDEATSRLPHHPGCRTLARARIGAAESRAMIGGAPFECLTIKDESRCAWIWP